MGNKCYRCGRFHNPQSCPARFWTCHKCSRQGHTAPNCRTNNTRAQHVEEVPQDLQVYQEEEDALEELFGETRIYQVKNNSLVVNQEEEYMDLVGSIKESEVCNKKFSLFKVLDKEPTIIQNVNLNTKVKY